MKAAIEFVVRAGATPNGFSARWKSLSREVDLAYASARMQISLKPPLPPPCGWMDIKCHINPCRIGRQRIIGIGNESSCPAAALGDSRKHGCLKVLATSNPKSLDGRIRSLQTDRRCPTLSGVPDNWRIRQDRGPRGCVSGTVRHPTHLPCFLSERRAYPLQKPHATIGSGEREAELVIDNANFVLTRPCVPGQSAAGQQPQSLASSLWSAALLCFIYGDAGKTCRPRHQDWPVQTDARRVFLRGTRINTTVPYGTHTRALAHSLRTAFSVAGCVDGAPHAALWCFVVRCVVMRCGALWCVVVLVADISGLE